MKSETKKPEKRRKRPFLTTLGVLIVFLIVVLIAALALPPVALRYVFSRVEAETGITVTFDKAYLYLDDGSYLYIEGLAIKRQKHHSSNLDLKVESVRMPAMFPADFYSPVLYVNGLRGTIERVGSEPAKKENDKEERASQKFDLKALLVRDVQIDFIDRTLEKPFQTTIQVEYFFVHQVGQPSLYKRTLLFEPYEFMGEGKIGTAQFRSVGISMNPSPPLHLKLTEVPFDLLSPYAPVLDDIFVKGSMNIEVHDITNETQKRVYVKIWLQPDCKIKSANEILAPAIQAALRQLDQNSMPELPDVRKKIERLKTSAEPIRAELDRATRVLDSLRVLAPREVRDEYDKIKNQYDKAMWAYDEWNAKFETFVQDLDRAKNRIVENTFQAFIDADVPIEVKLQEVDGEWQYDGYAVVIGLVERNYQTILAAEFQRRFQEIQDAVERLLAP
ncbi:MAG: hypothetical protein FWE95_02395 [Planctomycetaceae bacterium]|nr:hypothetical protein [Planctomycetaceae bacterium]